MRTYRLFMNTPSPFCTLNCSCDESLQWAKTQLSQAGLRVIQTFDLYEAAHLSSGDCPCSNHGSEKCDCQMVVLLVYGNEKDPGALILHGSNRQTWLSIVETPDQNTNRTISSVIKKLLGGKPPAQIPNLI